MAQNKALRQVDGLIEFKQAEAELIRAEAMKKWNGSVPTQIIQGNGKGELPVFPFMNAMKGIK